MKKLLFIIVILFITACSTTIKNTQPFTQLFGVSMQNAFENYYTIEEKILQMSKSTKRSTKTMHN